MTPVPWRYRHRRLMAVSRFLLRRGKVNVLKMATGWWLRESPDRGAGMREAAVAPGLQILRAYHAIRRHPAETDCAGTGTANCSRTRLAACAARIVGPEPATVHFHYGAVVAGTG